MHLPAQDDGEVLSHPWPRSSSHEHQNTLCEAQEQLGELEGRGKQTLM